MYLLERWRGTWAKTYQPDVEGLILNALERDLYDQVENYRLHTKSTKEKIEPYAQLATHNKNYIKIRQRSSQGYVECEKSPGHMTEIPTESLTCHFNFLKEWRKHNRRVHGARPSSQCHTKKGKQWKGIALGGIAAKCICSTSQEE
eukprot:scaffold8207_cov96-Cylindrotheca_fusiformis.AAC.2